MSARVAIAITVDQVSALRALSAGQGVESLRVITSLVRKGLVRENGAYYNPVLTRAGRAAVRFIDALGLR